VTTTILGTWTAQGHQDVVKRCVLLAVIPAKAGIHFALAPKIKMDSGLRRNDGKGSDRQG
jgi:hypothetical protein